MRKLLLIGVVILVLGYLPCQAQYTLYGDWVGGIDFGKSWQPVNFHFKTEKEGITGSLDLPQQGRNGLPLNRVVLESSRVHIEWQGRSGLAIYEGELKDGGIVGSFQQGRCEAVGYSLAGCSPAEPASE